MRCLVRLRQEAQGAISPLNLPIIAAFLLLGSTLCNAGPIERTSRMIGDAVPLDSNITSGQIGEACAVGDVVYMPGDTVPGSIPCELCICGPAGGVQCEPIECEPRPGCKALHRPDHCCPLYQCECEENGRKYANGEKLVDPVDPCRVCYCQGGVVVCSRLACFHRDDCDPRFVDGQCCPKYDHCPTRDHKLRTTDNSTTSIMKPQLSVDSNADESNSLKQNSEPFENSREIEGKDTKNIEKLKNTTTKVSEIRIKEVTQKMEIPADTGIRIKEVHPLINREINQYTIGSTKAPLSARDVEYNTQTSIKESKMNSNNNDTKDSVNITVNAYPSPPVLRIGDQLVFLKVGDSMPESDSQSTPATVITVFGAEGLIRGEEEELVENETNHDLESKEYGTSQIQTSTNQASYNSTTESTNLLSANVSETPKLQENIETKLPGVTVPQSFAESITTNIEILGKTVLEVTTEKIGTSSESFTNSNDLPHRTNTVTSSEYTSVVTESTYETSTTEQSISREITTEEQLQPQQRNYETKIIVKRPVIYVPNLKMTDNEKLTKILSTLLPSSADIITEETSTVSATAEKDLFESTKLLNHISNSPMLNLNATLPDEMLRTTSHMEMKDNIDYNMENEKSEQESDGIASDELLIELRAPGEPLLIPEWERNITTNIATEATQKDININFDFKKDTSQVSTMTSVPIDMQTNNNYRSDFFETQDISREFIQSTNSETMVSTETYDMDMSNISDSILSENKLITEVSQHPSTEKFITTNVYYSTSSVDDNSIPTTTISDYSELNEPSLDSNLSDDKTKNKSNILADLISLVGDVAAIGDHNDQENLLKKNQQRKPNSNEQNLQINEDEIAETSKPNKGETREIELSDITPFEDHDLPSEHKIEPTTQKVIIDNISKINNNESKVVDTNDIELIPKIENNPKPGDNEPRKIIQDPFSSRNNSSKIYMKTKKKQKVIITESSTLQSDSTSQSNIGKELVKEESSIPSDVSENEFHRLVNSSKDSEK